MDAFSHRLANALVANPRTAATLEVAMLGPEIDFEDERVIAIAGAQFVVTVDGQTVPHARPFVVAPGGRLRFGERLQGARAYVAIEGGIEVPSVLGSRSTHLFTAMGGWNGRSLVQGDRLPLGARMSAPLPRYRPSSQAQDAEAVARFVAGPDEAWFADDALDILQSGPYIVDIDSDRMGFRLTGPKLTLARGADITSDVTPVGTLQVPGSAQPILLMADRQTTGGYPRIGVVITADLTIAAQVAPGETLAFRQCTHAAAVAALIAQERRLLAVEMAF